MRQSSSFTETCRSPIVFGLVENLKDQADIREMLGCRNKSTSWAT